jgi:hypothetical protein
MERTDSSKAKAGSEDKDGCSDGMKERRRRTAFRDQGTKGREAGRKGELAPSNSSLSPSLISPLSPDLRCLDAFHLSLFPSRRIASLRPPRPSPSPPAVPVVAVPSPFPSRSAHLARHDRLPPPCPLPSSSSFDTTTRSNDTRPATGRFSRNATFRRFVVAFFSERNPSFLPSTLLPNASYGVTTTLKALSVVVVEQRTSNTVERRHPGGPAIRGK